MSPHANSSACRSGRLPLVLIGNTERCADMLAPCSHWVTWPPAGSRLEDWRAASSLLAASRSVSLPSGERLSAFLLQWAELPLVASRLAEAPLGLSPLVAVPVGGRDGMGADCAAAQ